MYDIIDDMANRIRILEAENAELRARFKKADRRAEVAERALDKACADVEQLTDCCRWAANGGIITIEEYTPEKATPQAYIDRAEKELTEEREDDNALFRQVFYRHLLALGMVDYKDGNFIYKEGDNNE